MCVERNIWIHAYTATSWVEKWAKLQYITHSLAYIYICIQHFKYLVSHKYVFGLSKVTQYLRFPSHVLIWTAHTHTKQKNTLSWYELIIRLMRGKVCSCSICGAVRSHLLLLSTWNLHFCTAEPCRSLIHSHIIEKYDQYFTLKVAAAVI